MTIYEEAERDDWGRTEAERELFFAQLNLNLNSFLCYFTIKKRQTELSLERIKNNQYLDLKFGFKTIINEERLGWLLNLHPTSIVDPETKKQKSAVDFYFVQEDGSRFKTTFVFRPYFYISCKPDTEVEVEFYLKKKFSDILVALTILEKEDLDMSNHLIGIKRKYLKLEFLNVKDLLKVRKVLHPLVLQNQENLNLKNLYDLNKENSSSDVLAYVLDIREYDVPYHIRVAIDLSIYVGRWYEVRVGASNPSFTLRTDMEERPDLTVLAFDIETTKLPLKFPDSDIDSVMMVSYMVDGQGYLVVNRELISEDIADFEYTPTPEYEGPFTVFNEPNEKATLEKFIAHIQEIKPCIIVTFNGDYFDWPFVDKRANVNGIDIMGEVGFGPDAQDEYKSRPIIHMDAFKWVKRDSYLPQGSHGLKAVTKAKLAYDPLEINPEDMCRFASERPQALANYSVSDAVATYYLYMKYIHPFIFSLCSIIPLEPDEVLRKGSGTLCETLLMVEAFKADVIMPNKHHPPHTKFYKGKFIESETYVGGHVESLEAGVFRSNIPVDFDLDGLALDELKSGVPEALRYTLEKELEVDLSTIRNFDEVLYTLFTALFILIILLERLSLNFAGSWMVPLFFYLRVAPKRAECPLIYHLDVSAMYPNIILTNRLQPFAIVDEATCAACDFNQSGLQCQRIMDWKWRMEYIPASKPEYEHVKLHLESERFPNLDPKKASKKPQLAFYELSEAEQAKFIKMRLADLSKKIHKKSKVATVIDRTSTICMRENPFYIDTVRAFRDRRYIYKGRAVRRYLFHVLMRCTDKLKAWQSKLARATEVGERQSIKNMIVVYDSLQLAHKCILNSFYGYVMRKGARWFSMEMAGIVCLTGSAIIQKARKIVERIGKPLELDTDGIWCAFPSSFPENVVLNRINGEPDIVVSYPGAMLNVMVGNTFTNHQYHVLEDKAALRYSQRSENTIFFEVDGPYRAMILPASKEEDKVLARCLEQ
ncbi:hypothetical protein Zmor_016309 [Zophobas morio]|uniref:DNA polymerase epsilon catalytic subunit n=1 Tax=Zophobas morio TaxID=2755281 RepID=A0AA38HEC6_9CUCU|nr:hypothetical protein Zmor_016309 [Zophobas morio]